MVFSSNIISLLKEKSGLSFDKAKDFDILCVDILEKTKRYIGVTTMKRLLGYISDSRNPNEYTLNTISIYLGYNSWSEMCGSMRINSVWNFSSEKIYVSDLEIGESLTVFYLDRVVSFQVVDFHDRKALQVTKVKNSSLKKGDVLLIDYLEIGSILEAKEVYRDNLLGNYRTNQELFDIQFD